MTDAPAAPATPASDRPATTPPSARHRRRAGLWIALGAGAVVIAAAVAHQAASAWLYDRALVEWTAIDVAEGAAYQTLQAQVDRSAPTVSRGDELAAAITPDLVPAEHVDALSASLSALRSELDRADATASAADVDLTLPAFAPAWDRYAALVRMATLAPERLDSAAGHEAATDEVVDAQHGVEAAIETVFADAASAAETHLASSPSATYRAQLDVRRLVAMWPDDGQPESAADYTGLLTVLADLRTSHEAGEARNADPGQATRLEIEAFARSVSYGGVPLDFAWAYEVAGVTSDSWIAGTAEFWPGEYWTDGDVGWGHITLSESVEEHWGEVDAEALVVHEVGHVQVIREACAAIFQGPVFAGDHELWATAWAIGMGYDVPGSGIEAYGRPSAEQIEASKGCR